MKKKGVLPSDPKSKDLIFSPFLEGKEGDTFIRTLWESGAIKVGNFKTKSKRTSSYFINTSAFCNGKLFA